MKNPRAKSKRQRSRGIRTSGGRERKKEQTKERILEAALELFRKKGWERATTREVAAKAGIAEGTLFNYFKTKEDLALFFFQKATDDVITWHENEPALNKAGLAERLFAILQRQLDYIAPYENFIGAAFFRSLQPRSKLGPFSLESQELRAKYLRFIRDILDEAADRGEIGRLGELGAYALGLYYVGILTHWLHDSSKGKEKTLALLDRSLQIGVRALTTGAWEW